LEKLLVIALALSLGAPLAADGPGAVSPAAQALPSPVSSPAAPVSAAAPSSPSAMAPTAPAAPALAAPTGLQDALSQTAAPLALTASAADSADPAPPEEVADPLALTAQPLDLGALASPILLKLARALSKGSDKVWFDPDLQQALTGSTPGAQSAAADALFAELNRRAAQGDKEAKQALDLAVKLHGDLRALPVTADAPALSPSAQAATSPSAQALSPSAAP
jgi:hypothetical protein